MQSFDLIAHLHRQRAFSRATFGPGLRTKGVADHIRKELGEIESDPRDLMEWVDVILLGLDGLWRAAEATNTPLMFAVTMIEAKQSKNERRDWPDWRTADPDKAIEHKRAAEAPASRDCPYVSCPSPYLCKASCKVSVSERGHLAATAGRS